MNELSSSGQLMQTGTVVEKFSEIEGQLDQIIFRYVQPRVDAEDFVLMYLLNNSIISFASKLKLLQIILKSKSKPKVNESKFHKLLKIRNAFAHNNVGSKLEVEFIENGGVNLYFYMESLEGNGEIKKTKRVDAFNEFISLHKEIYPMLGAIINSI